MNGQSISIQIKNAISDSILVIHNKEIFTIRDMNLDDVAQVHRLEQQIFTSPWPKEAIENDILAKNTSISLVVELEEDVIGYFMADIIVNELHITNIAIVPEHRRKKISETILKRILSQSLYAGLDVAYLEVRRSNISAIGLYNKLGFTIVGERKKYYRDNEEDALLMTCDLYEFNSKLGEYHGMV